MSSYIKVNYIDYIYIYIVAMYIVVYEELNHNEIST